MRRSHLVVGTVLGALGATAFMVWPAGATFEGGPGSRIQVTGVDGQSVTVGGVIDSITNIVSVDGTVELGTATQAALTALPTCTESRGSGFALPVNTLRRARPYLGDGGMDTSFTRWTSVEVVNSDDKDLLRCASGALDAGGPPSCATSAWVGQTIFYGGGYRKYSSTELEEIWCIACGGDTAMDVTAEECVP